MIIHAYVNHIKVLEVVKAFTAGKPYLIRLSLILMILFLFGKAFPQEYFQQEVTLRFMLHSMIKAMN